MEFQIFFHEVTFCLPLCLDVSQMTEAFHGFSPLFLIDPTESEEQRYLLLLCGLRLRQFRWFLICVELTCRDSTTNLSAPHARFRG